MLKYMLEKIFQEKKKQQIKNHMKMLVINF